MSECHEPGCSGYDPAVTDQCRYPGCGRRWTTDIEMEDGWCAFLCDEHADGFPDSDPVHGRVIAFNVRESTQDARAAMATAQAADSARLERAVIRNTAARRRPTRAARRGKKR
jgi:hypothetical protein